MPKKKRRSVGFIVKKGRIQWLNLIIVLVVLGGLGWTVKHKLAASAAPTTQQSTSVTLSHAEFIQKLVPDAQKMQTKYHVLASISLSQAILESDWGRSANAQQNNNLFGVKAAADEKGKLMATQEYHDGAYHNEKHRFKVYSSWHASMVGHARKLADGTTWDPNLYQGVIHAKNYRIAAVALSNAGYATDPSYAQKLINIIQKYDLQRYDKK